MGLAAGFSILLGVFPEPLYRILPYPVDYIPYSGAHVMGQLQLLMFGALAFCLLILSGYYPPEMRAINLDTDWFYRKGGWLFYRFVDSSLNGLNRICEGVFVRRFAGSLARFFQNAPRGFSMGVSPVGLGALAAALFIAGLFLLH